MGVYFESDYSFVRFSVHRFNVGHESCGALGVKAPQSLSQKVWGTLVPYESVFLFDADRRLIASDVRSVSNTTMRQRFVSTKVWLDLCPQEPVS